jgi:hypothetical protein
MKKIAILMIVLLVMLGCVQGVLALDATEQAEETAQTITAVIDGGCRLLMRAVHIGVPLEPGMVENCGDILKTGSIGI